MVTAPPEPITPTQAQFEALRSAINGTVHTDQTTRISYATDASIYKRLPACVVFPTSEEDIVTIVQWCAAHDIPLTVRSGGTSLAGQCVTHGVVMDVSRHMHQIVQENLDQGSITVQPGLVLETLNHHVAKHGWMFGPNTSTSNRCTIGGMVGNNSSGTSSIRYGTTRDHIKQIRVVLGTGEVIILRRQSPDELKAILNQKDIEGKIYRQFRTLLGPDEIQKEITSRYPKASITRRNGGYAFDLVLDQILQSDMSATDNLTPFFCGTEGTLGIVSEITLQLVPIPPKKSAMMLVHFESMAQAMEAVPIIMRGKPYLCELMDRTILRCTADHESYKKDLDLITGDPAAVLMVQYHADEQNEVDQWMSFLREALEQNDLGYAYTILTGEDIQRAFLLRKAGLGLLALLPGDKKAVACIEDTAVDIKDLKSYISEFAALMHRHHQEAVYYAHAGAGELHLRPILDLKRSRDRKSLRDITADVAQLVQKYNGSMTGEHGDGIVRSEAIAHIYGPQIMDLHAAIKKCWDPKGILNPGKIVRPWPMDEQLRTDEEQVTPEIDTIIRFDDTQGMLRMAERCNGSGDCRKGPLAKGGMCPSYHATRDEIHTTRARANVLREQMYAHKTNAFQQEEVIDVLQHCISCKLCKSECPSQVDMARLKTEALYQRFLTQKDPIRDAYIQADKNIHRTHQLGGIIQKIASSRMAERVMRKRLDIHPERSIPTPAKKSLTSWWTTKGINNNPIVPKESVLFFNDEFTNHLEPEIGIKMISFLQHIGFDIQFYSVKNSGRAAISFGDLKRAKHIAERITKKLSKTSIKITGVEPSAVLGIKDEYPLLVHDSLVETAKRNIARVHTFSELILYAHEKGWISSDSFDDTPRHIAVHVHCHQKALSDKNAVARALSIANTHTVVSIDSGCCGMAGSYGYKKENYDMSIRIADTILFPALRNVPEHTYVVASGTSCRHQIKDGLQKRSYHPAEIMYDALKK